MTVIWDNCDTPSQLDTRSFLRGLSTHKKKKKKKKKKKHVITLGQSSPFFLPLLKSGEGVSNKWNITALYVDTILLK